jgi:hypothetical protein
MKSSQSFTLILFLLTLFSGISWADRASAGKVTLPDGGQCDGDIVNGVLNGKATCTYANKDRYVGSFSNGKFSGTGKYTFAAGDTYEGQFANGQIQGKGKKTYADGDVYEGDFIKGEPNGKGIYISKGVN